MLLLAVACTWAKIVSSYWITNSGSWFSTGINCVQRPPQPAKWVGTCQSTAGKWSLFLLLQPKSDFGCTQWLSVWWGTSTFAATNSRPLGLELSEFVPRSFNGCRDSINVSANLPANSPKIAPAYISESQLLPVFAGCLFLWAGQWRSTYLSKAESFTKPQSFSKPNNLFLCES